MNMYWVYNLPIWLFGVLAVLVTTVISLIGMYATRKWVRRVHGLEHSHNDVVGYYLGAGCLFYGITLGLLAVGTWQAYSDVDNKVSEEASALAGLYRDVSGFPEPARTSLQSDLRDYIHEIIYIVWPLERRGIVPKTTGPTLAKFQTGLANFEPVTEGQKTLQAEAYREFDRMIELRRIRLRSAVVGLPSTMWCVLLIGAFLNIAMTWFFDMKSFSMHAWMTVMFSAVLGLLIFLLAALDNPFRGKISVGPEAFRLVYDELMKPEK